MIETFYANSTIIGKFFSVEIKTIVIPLNFLFKLTRTMLTLENL